MKHVLLSLTLVSLLAMATGCRPIFTDQRPREMVYSGPAEQQPAAMQQAQVQGQMPEPCPVHGYACPAGCNWRLGRPGRPMAGNADQPFNPGPPSAQVTNPYYTLRGPRDFLQTLPTPIGP